MLVPGAGRALEGTGRPAELSPSGSNPVTGTAHRQEDKGGTITKPRRFNNRAPSNTHTFAKLEIRIFLVPPPLGVGVFGKLPAARKRKDRQRNRLARSQRLRLSREPKARWRPGSADRTAPEQISQAPGLREFRLAASQQILPLIGNRKPASDRGHWLQPAPCSSRRRSCPGGERGDRQSSVPADSTPSQTQPTGRRIGGYDYKTESFQRPRAEQHAHSREMKLFVFALYGYGFRMAGHRPKPNAINQLTGNPGNRLLIGRYRITAQSCLVFALFLALFANCGHFCVGWRRET